MDLVSPPAKLDRVVNDLIQTGICVLPNFYEKPEVQALAAEAITRWTEGDFSAAQIGRGSERVRHSEIRSDHILWIDELMATPAVRRHLQFVESLRIALNREFMLGLFEFEGHFAMYPAGSFYQRHLDCFLHLKRRLVTVIVYLNEDWTAADGGTLRVYTNGESTAEYTDVLPAGGTLVAFASDRFYHEVLPARRERLSLTGWLCRRN